MHFYKVYGLRVASELELPELTPCSQYTLPEVTIALRPVNKKLKRSSYVDHFFEVSGDICLFRVQGVARYKIEQGKRIFVDIESNVTSSEVRLYLLGSALGVLLHQRKCLPLHVSAVESPTGLWAFTGPSGAGKSTLAAVLHYEFGWPIVTDDVGVVYTKDSLAECFLYPGPPRIKLWKDAAYFFNLPTQSLATVSLKIDKYSLRLDSRWDADFGPRKVVGLVSLEEAMCKGSASLLEVAGADAFEIIKNATYRPNLSAYANDLASMFRLQILLSNRITVCRYIRPFALRNILEHAKPLVDLMSHGKLN